LLSQPQSAVDPMPLPSVGGAGELDEVPEPAEVANRGRGRRVHRIPKDLSS
jgi:hypothetical protein